VASLVFPAQLADKLLADRAIENYAIKIRGQDQRKMADVTLELMFEVLKSVQARLTQVDGKIDELKQEMQASRTSLNGIHQEITGVFQEILGIHATLVRHEGRLDRIERRLELNDATAS
jgi:septal ring factor EnvC (AmiA/AmiB activator)